MTLIVALRKFYGYRKGEGLKDFSAEYKALTEADKEWFAQELTKNFGEPVTVSPPAGS
jgi:hypothetical protein